MTSILDEINRAARHAQTARGGVELVGGTFVDKHDDFHARVDVLGEEIVLPALLGQYRRGGGVNVQRDGRSGKATLVYGPAEGGEETDGREIVVVGGKLAETLDPETREKANRALEQLAVFFTHSDRDPLPEDGAGKPEGAYWIRLDGDGGDAARWRWVEGEWVEAPLGPELILREAVISSLITNEVFTQNLVLADEVDGWLSRVSGRGLETFTPEGVAAIQLGNFGENYMQLATTAGIVGVSIDQEGGVAALNISAASSLQYRGDELADLFDAKPGGLVAYGVRSRAPSVIASVGVEQPFLRMSFRYDGGLTGRTYEICTTPVNMQATTGDTDPYVQIRGAAGTIGTTSDPVLAVARCAPTGGSHVQRSPASFSRLISVGPGATGTYGLILTFGNAGSGGEATIVTSGGRTVQMWVKEVGPNLINSAQELDGGTGGGGTGGGTDTDETKKRYVNVPFGYAWHKVWQQDGTAPAAAQGDVKQGRTPDYPAAGIYRSMVGFENMTSALSGADIELMQVRVRAEHWYSHAGGRVYLGLHGATGAPTNWQGVATGMAQAPLSIGGEAWITIPSQYYAGFRDGIYRGVTVFWDSPNAVHYGRFTPGRFAIRATYTK